MPIWANRQAFGSAPITEEAALKVPHLGSEETGGLTSTCTAQARSEFTDVSILPEAGRTRYLGKREKREKEKQQWGTS